MAARKSPLETHLTWASCVDVSCCCMCTAAKGSSVPPTLDKKLRAAGYNRVFLWRKKGVQAVVACL